MKCGSIKCNKKFCEGGDNLKHLNRIKGQLEKLEEYIKNGEECKNIAMLMKSVSASFESLKNKTMKNFVLNELGENITKKQIENIETIFETYKK